MSNHAVPITDERHAARYKDGEHLNYDLMPEHLHMLVDSSRIAGLRYHVWIDGTDVFCNCTTTSEDTCRHRAVCVAHFFPAIWLRWFDAECQEWIEFRDKIRTHNLSVSDKRKLNKYIALAESLRPVELETVPF